MPSLFSAPNTAPKAANSRLSRISPKRMQIPSGQRNQSSPASAGSGSTSGRLFGATGRELVDAFAQFLARLAMRHVLARQGDGRSGLRIAPHARWAIVQRETAEAADFDALAVRQRVAHLLHHAFDGEFHVIERQVILACG